LSTAVILSYNSTGRGSPFSVTASKGLRIELNSLIIASTIYLSTQDAIQLLDTNITQVFTG
jgi:hypothetical protein